MKGVGSQVSTCLPYAGIEISWFFCMRDDGGARTVQVPALLLRHSLRVHVFRG